MAHFPQYHWLNVIALSGSMPLIKLLGYIWNIHNSMQWVLIYFHFVDEESEVCQSHLASKKVMTWNSE
jgi:hypothetical protein